MFLLNNFNFLDYWEFLEIKIFILVLPYPLEYNHGVLFFNMSFWVRFNSKKFLKKWTFLPKIEVLFKKKPKNRTFEKG